MVVGIEDVLTALYGAQPELGPPPETVPYCCKQHHDGYNWAPLFNVIPKCAPTTGLDNYKYVAIPLTARVLPP